MAPTEDRDPQSSVTSGARDYGTNTESCDVRRARLKVARSGPEGLTVARVEFRLEAETAVELPEYSGSTFRGGFGRGLRRVGCVRAGACRRCVLGGRCVYGYVFETPVPSDAEVLSKNSHAPHPFVLELPTGQCRVEPGSEFGVGMTLVGRAIDYLPYCVLAFEEFGRCGIGRSRGRFRVREVAAGDGDTRVRVYDGRAGRFLASPTVLRPGLTDPDDKGVDRVVLEFVTAARLKHEGRLVSEPEFHVVFRSLLRRISSLLYFHCGVRLDADFRGLIRAAADVRVETAELRWKDWSRYSARQRARMRYGGVLGRVTYCGRMGPFLPYLRAGEHVHVGKHTSFGLGRYRLILGGAQ